MGLFSSTGQPHKWCALRWTAAGGRGEGVEWRGREGRGGQGRVPDCLGGLSRVGISSRSTRPWNGQPPSTIQYTCSPAPPRNAARASYSGTWQTLPGNPRWKYNTIQYTCSLAPPRNAGLGSSSGTWQTQPGNTRGRYNTIE